MHMLAQHPMVASNRVEDPRIVMTLTPTSQRYVHQTAFMAIADMGCSLYFLLDDDLEQINCRPYVPYAT